EARMATEFHVSSTCAPWRQVSTTKLSTSSLPSLEALTTAYFKMGDSVANVFLPLRMYLSPSFLAVDSGLPHLVGLPVAGSVARLLMSEPSSIKSAATFLYFSSAHDFFSPRSMKMPMCQPMDRAVAPSYLAMIS